MKSVIMNKTHMEIYNEIILNISNYLSEKYTNYIKENKEFNKEISQYYIIGLITFSFAVLIYNIINFDKDNINYIRKYKDKEEITYSKIYKKIIGIEYTLDSLINNLNIKEDMLVENHKEILSHYENLNFIANNYILNKNNVKYYKDLIAIYTVRKLVENMISLWGYENVFFITNQNGSKHIKMSDDGETVVNNEKECLYKVEFENHMIKHFNNKYNIYSVDCEKESERLFNIVKEINKSYNGSDSIFCIGTIPYTEFKTEFINKIV